MGFTQVDENTVRDDEGNTYYSPFLNYDASKLKTPELPSLVTRPGTETTEVVPPQEGLPSLEELKSPQTPTSLPSFSEAPTAPSTGTKDYKVDVGQTPLQKNMAASKITPEAQRDSAMRNDVADYSAKGGVAKSDEDMAKILGGRASHEAETAKAVAKAQAIAQEGEIAKTRKMAELTLETASEYESHVAKIMADSKERWTDWKKRNDNASAALVDPRNAFHNMSTLTKIGWALQFIGAGLQGTTATEGVQRALNKLVDEDITAQKLNTDNKRSGLESEKTMLSEQDKLGKDSVADWYAARQLRLSAVGKQLDAQIAAMGLPAAQAAGLLKARDAIEGEVVKGQQHISDHFFEQGKQKAGFAHDIYMERLKSKLRTEEDSYKEKIKKADDVDTLPTNTQLGLQMVDRQTGKAVEGGKVRLKVKGDKAVEAGKVLTDANYEASQLRDAKEMLKGLSTADIVRGGTPEFASVVTEVIQARAVRYNGHRLSDKDLEVAAKEVLGANVMVRDGVVTNLAAVVRQVGGTKEGIEKVFNRELRNLSTQTVNKLHPYIDSDTAQKFDIQFNIQDTNNPELSKTPDDMNTAITKAAGGANTSDLLVPGPRAPVSKDIKFPADFAENQVYESEKTKGRGTQGGLPRLMEGEEAKVEQATVAFEHAPADDILRLSQAYLRDKRLSEEAKHEIRIEAQIAIKKANEIEQAVQEEAMQDFTHISGGGEEATYGVNAKDAVTTPSGEYTEEFKKYLESDLVNEMRRRAGLEPRAR